MKLHTTAIQSCQSQNYHIQQRISKYQTAYTMAPRSLYEQAKSATIRHIDLLTDIGDLPYSFMKPVLLRLENPDQLRELEKTCPQLLGEDGDIWLKFIKRDIPNWEKKAHEPRNPQLWWKVYKKLVKEAEEDARQAEEVLRLKMAERAAERVKHTIAAPVMMLPEKGPKKRNVPTTFSKTADKSVLRFTGGSKTKNVMERARREAAEAKLRKIGTLNTPTHLLQSSRITKVPQYMIDDRRDQAPRPSFKLSRPTPTTSKVAPKAQPSAALGLAERETRLKAMQSASTGASSTPAAHASLAAGVYYKVPALGRTGSPMARVSSPMVRPASPPKKRKREVDVFMTSKRR